MAKKEDISFVKIENANMVKLSLKQLAELYTDYAHLILKVKDLTDKKMSKKNELFAKIKDLESRYAMLMKELPKLPEGTKIERPEYPIASKPSYLATGEEDPFEELRHEFASIRSELEKLR